MLLKEDTVGCQPIKCGSVLGGDKIRAHSVPDHYHDVFGLTFGNHRLHKRLEPKYGSANCQSSSKPNSHFVLGCFFIQIGKGFRLSEWYELRRSIRATQGRMRSDPKRYCVVSLFASCARGA